LPPDNLETKFQMNSQEIISFLSEKMRTGQLTASQANVEKVRMERVCLVTGRISSEVRSALNGAVKSGALGHMKKDGHRPEAYFHPSFDYLANGRRAEAADQKLRTLIAVSKAVFA